MWTTCTTGQAAIFPESVGAFFELLKTDPFVVCMGLTNIARAENRDVVQFRETCPVRAVGNGDRFGLAAQL